jgi:hypothetical protein
VLLAAGADVNARSTYDVSPLSFASHGGHVAVVKRLLAAGADPTDGLMGAAQGNPRPLMFAGTSAKN